MALLWMYCRKVASLPSEFARALPNMFRLLFRVSEYVTNSVAEGGHSFCHFVHVSKSDS